MYSVNKTFFFASASQGVDGAPALDVMLLKQKFFSVSGSNRRRNEEDFQYAHRRNHPLLQFLQLKAGGMDRQELG